EQREAEATVRSAIDRGITLIDTAPIYGQGQSEEIVGKAVAESGRRDDLVLATKVGLDWEDGIRRDSSPERIRREVEDSLRRLRTDVIDIYQVHWPDAAVPFEETAATLQQLREEGKIRSIGVSNYAPEEMERFRDAATLDVLQPPYNIFERGIEEQHLPYCREHGIAVLAYGALCRGLLAGTLREDSSFPKGDLRRNDPKFRSPRFAQYLAATAELDRWAREKHDVGVLEFAVRWLLDSGADVALWGARKPSQLDRVSNVSGWKLAEVDMQEVDRILAAHIEDPVGPEFMAPPEN
ncbi:MAG: aldo/keto reductase, partial [Bacteroidota bacterium]|nr:aldo/keto reductase [Bacteroidota bacterium]